MACGRNEPPAITTRLGVPGHVNEHVSVASDGGCVVALAWSVSSESTGTNIFASVSVDEGQTFSAPVRVSASDPPASVNGEQPPRVALTRAPRGNDAIVVLWTAKVEGRTLLLSARSTDRGRSFGLTHQHQHGADAASTMDGVVRAEQSQLFVSSVDGSLAPKSIARGVCYCCKTALIAGPDGTEAPGAYPALALTAGHAVLAWAQRGEQESRIAVQRIAY
jgi:hypothetical protein